jgi:hypothetical protein
MSMEIKLEQNYREDFNIAVAKSGLKLEGAEP